MTKVGGPRGHKDARARAAGAGVAAQPEIVLADLLPKLRTRAAADALGAIHARVAPTIDRHAMDPRLSSDPRMPDRFDEAVASFFTNNFMSADRARREMEAAVVDAFVVASKGTGRLTVEQARRALGPRGAQLLEMLAQTPAPPQDDPLADRHVLDGLGRESVKAILDDVPLVAPKLPALEQLARMIADPDEFDGFAMMGLQHLFASSGALFEQLHAHGVQFADMRLLGKIYSTNWRVAAELEARGAEVDGASRKNVAGVPFEKSMEEAIELNLRVMIASLPHPPEANPTPRCLLVDDGGEAIRILHSEQFKAWAPYFACVEQTRRGARIVHELEERGELRCAVANVAESWAKLEMESPMIGRSVALEVRRKLDRLQTDGVDTGREAVVVGYGAVGKAVAKSLMERGYTVHVYDRDPSRLQDLPAGMVGHADLTDALPHANVLVSCVGMQTLYPSDHGELPDGAILVNAASSDDELGPEELLPFRKPAIRDDEGRFWSTFQGKVVNTGYAEAEAHSDTVVRLPSGKELLVASNGYVVNMTGERDPIPARFIQLTRALLFMGAVVAKRADGPGIKELPLEWQQALVNLVQRELKKTGEKLEDPRWDERDPPPPPVKIDPPPAALELLADDRATRRPAVDDDARVGDGDGALSPDEAAIKRATLSLNRHFKTNLLLSTRPDAPLVHERERREDQRFLPGGTVDTTVKVTTPEQRFALTYGSLVSAVAHQLMTKRDGVAPDADAHAREVAAIWKNSSVDPAFWLAVHDASADAADRDHARRVREHLR